MKKQSIFTDRLTWPDSTKDVSHPELAPKATISEEERAMLARMKNASSHVEIKGCSWTEEDNDDALVSQVG